MISCLLPVRKDFPNLLRWLYKMSIPRNNLLAWRYLIFVPLLVSLFPALLLFRLKVLVQALMAQVQIVESYLPTILTFHLLVQFAILLRHVNLLILYGSLFLPLLPPEWGSNNSTTPIVRQKNPLFQVPNQWFLQQENCFP